MAIKVVISDWDETITAKDTLSLVGHAAYHAKPSFEPSWQYFTDQYINDYNKFVSSRTDKDAKSRTTLDQEARYLSDLREVELRSVARVETSNLFQGVPLDEVRAQSKLVEMRDGFWEALQDLLDQGITFIIVSVNWSQAFIEQVFIDHGYRPDQIKIYANEIETDDKGIGTGLLGGGHNLRTAADKLKLVKSIKKKFSGESVQDIGSIGSKNDQSDISVSPSGVMFLGDSLTDLLAILEADVGVVVVKESLLLEFDRLGLRNQVKYIKHWSELQHLLDNQ
jgi:2-hydroxy-3-keto-5-methylthiopentenyl-1-phosphate phosphatase